MKTSYLVSTAALIAASGLLIVGCAAEVSDPETGVAEQEIGEAACGTVSADKLDTAITGACGDGSSYDSGDNLDNHSTCVHAYIVQYTQQGTSTSSGPYGAQLYVVPTTMPTTSTSCASVHSKAYVYDAAGALVTSTAMHGSWNSTLGACFMVYDSGYSAIGISSLGQDHRVVATAYNLTYTYSGGLPTPHWTYIPVRISASVPGFNCAP